MIPAERKYKMSYRIDSTEDLLDRYGISDSRMRDEILQNDSYHSRSGYFGSSYCESDHVWETAGGSTVINGIDIDTGEYVGHDFD